MIDLDIEFWNEKLRHKSPIEIAEWALRLSENRIVTTSFGVYSSVLLSTMSRLDDNIRVVWCDTLFNSQGTYTHSAQLIERFNLNILKYQSILSKEEIEQTIGLPGLDNDNHELFSEVVKLEPFRRALKEQDPEVWFTNIRVRQTEYRNEKDILSYSKDGILKVSPFYYCSDEDLDAYIEANDLPKNTDYFDPVKVLQQRECGIHFQ